MENYRKSQNLTLSVGMHTTTLVAVLALVNFGLLCPSHGYAGQLYFDRGEFLSAIVNEVVIDFEDQPLGPIAGDPWLADGILFDQAGVGNNMTIGGGGSANKNIYALGGESADIDITFPNLVAAFGLGIFSNYVQDPSERIIFYTPSDSILANVEMPLTASQGTVFVGYVADAPMISKVAFIEANGDGDYVGIGDVAFMVPEPATLLLLGLGGLALLRKRSFR